MPAYLGALGALVPVDGVAQVQAGHERAVTTSTTIGGRVTAQVGPRVHRSWQVSLATLPAGSHAALAALVGGEFGLGPFWWVDQWAQVTNVLPPEASLLTVPWPGSSAGGPLALPDGARTGTSLVIASTANYVYLVGEDGAKLALPAVPGVPVTGTAWLSAAGQRVRVEAVDAAGTVLVTATGSLAVSGLARVSATLTPPADVEHVRLSVWGPGRVARPAMTWTPAATAWMPGQGAPSVLVGSMSQQPTLAGPDQHGQRVTGGFTITEVG